MLINFVRIYVKSIKQKAIIFLIGLFSLTLSAQDVSKVVTLPDLTIRTDLVSFDSEAFIKTLRNDGSFYKAFKAMNYYASEFKGELTVYKNNKIVGEVDRLAYRNRENQWMWVSILSEHVEGKLKYKKGSFNYKTAQAWDEVFFPQEKKEVNLSNPRLFEKSKEQTTLEKHKTELKQLMFNPGESVDGLPLIGDKLGIFKESMQVYYDFSVYQAYLKDTIECLVFEAEVKKGIKKSKTVIKRMVTFFHPTELYVLKRELLMEYRSIPLDFIIGITVENSMIDSVLLPEYIIYDGFFDLPFVKKEQINFKLFDFDYQRPIEKQP